MQHVKQLNFIEYDASVGRELLTFSMDTHGTSQLLFADSSAIGVDVAFATANPFLINGHYRSVVKSAFQK